MAARSDLLLQALKSFVASLSNSYDINELAFELSSWITEALGVAGAGVSVVDSTGALKFVTATSDRILQIEQAQELAQEGPCVTAFLTQRPLAISDISRFPDWPAYSSTAEQLGLQAVVGYPLSFDGERLGALNIYDDRTRDWTDEDLDIVGVFANMATASLVRISQLARSQQLAAQLQHALDSRILIEQAKGIVAAENGITVDDAFVRIRQHSQNSNLKLIEVCDGVVHKRLKIS